ncbi:MAG TPA: DUF262 domain-containing protein [Pyrinomonadaceae bacterium]|jgi:hypothetical protein
MAPRFDTRKYSIRDFWAWHTEGNLRLAPEFQRNKVWNDKARSYLIDTILRGKPIPKIYMRQILNLKERTTTREVVDGQQRLHAVLDFLNDQFKVSKAHNEDYAGKVFSGFDEDTQRDFFNYEFTVDLLQDMADDDVYDVFARLNTYTYKLTAQELRHAKWHGDFRTCAHRLANEFVTFWGINKIFSKASLLRMADAEFVSDLLIAMSDGIQEKSKPVIDRFYEKYDDSFPRRKTYEKRFREIMDHIGGIMEDDLPHTAFKTTRLLFPLFCAIYNLEHGLPDMNTEYSTIKASSYSRIKVALMQIDEIFKKVKEEGKTDDLAYLTVEQRKFYRAFTVYWVRAANRKFLTSYIDKAISKALHV